MNIGEAILQSADDATRMASGVRAMASDILVGMTDARGQCFGNEVLSEAAGRLDRVAHELHTLAESVAQYEAQIGDLRRQFEEI